MCLLSRVFHASSQGSGLFLANAITVPTAGSECLGAICTTWARAWGKSLVGSSSTWPGFAHDACRKGGPLQCSQFLMPNGLEAFFRQVKTHSGAQGLPWSGGFLREHVYQLTEQRLLSSRWAGDRSKGVATYRTHQGEVLQHLVRVWLAWVERQGSIGAQAGHWGRIAVLQPDALLVGSKLLCWAGLIWAQHQSLLQ